MTRIGRRLALGLAGLICSGLICVGGCSTEAGGPPAPAPGNRTAELRDTAVRAAEQTAVAVISLDRRDPEAGYARLLARLSGPARQEWEQQRAPRLAELTSDAVSVEQPAVTASGVAALDPAAPTATVLVAAGARVSSKQAPVAQERRYRLRLSLDRTAGEWKVSELQFVP
ncbi:MAG: hypothetical protein ACRDRV_21885 [Pseudonocardiaceae bacterium]